MTLQRTRLAICSAQHVERVGAGPVEVGKVPEVVGPVDEERHVDADDDDEEEEEELHVVPQVDPRDVVRQRLREALRPGLRFRRLRWHQPLADAGREARQDLKEDSLYLSSSEPI